MTIEWRCPFCGRKSPSSNHQGYSNRYSHAGLLQHISRRHGVQKHMIKAFTMPRKGTRG